LQEALQQSITDALEQLDHASALLSAIPDCALGSSTAVDDLLEDIIKKQNDIAQRHEAWADAHGELTQTIKADVSRGFTKALHSRCAPRFFCFAV
jgi:hypothetical protein